MTSKNRKHNDSGRGCRENQNNRDKDISNMEDLLNSYKTKESLFPLFNDLISFDEMKSFIQSKLEIISDTNHLWLKFGSLTDILCDNILQFMIKNYLNSKEQAILMSVSKTFYNLCQQYVYSKEMKLVLTGKEINFNHVQIEWIEYVDDNDNVYDGFVRASINLFDYHQRCKSLKTLDFVKKIQKWEIQNAASISNDVLKLLKKNNNTIISLRLEGCVYTEGLFDAFINDQMEQYAKDHEDDNDLWAQKYPQINSTTHLSLNCNIKNEYFFLDTFKSKMQNVKFLHIDFHVSDIDECVVNLKHAINDIFELKVLSLNNISRDPSNDQIISKWGIGNADHYKQHLKGLKIEGKCAKSLQCIKINACNFFIDLSDCSNLMCLTITSDNTRYGGYCNDYPILYFPKNKKNEYNFKYLALSYYKNITSFKCIKNEWKDNESEVINKYDVFIKDLRILMESIPDYKQWFDINIGHWIWNPLAYINNTNGSLRIWKY